MYDYGTWDSNACGKDDEYIGRRKHNNLSLIIIILFVPNDTKLFCSLLNKHVGTNNNLAEYKRIRSRCCNVRHIDFHKHRSDAMFGFIMHFAKNSLQKFIRFLIATNRARMQAMVMTI